MPQRGRGGERNGKPGQAYPNRSDIAQAPRAVPGQPYGQATQQLAAQAQMPLPGQPSPTGITRPPGPAPGSLGGLTDPTARPSEPLTAGLPQGPGPGPEAIGGVSDDPLLAQLRGLYSSYPNSDLGRLLTAVESQARTPSTQPPPPTLPPAM